MEDLRNKPESEMGVPLGGSFGRLISPYEAQELNRRENARKKKAAAELAAKEKRERRQMRHAEIREEIAFDKSFSGSQRAEAPSLSSQIGCAFICLTIFLFLAGFISFLSSLG